MMGLPAGTRIWLAAGVTDMRSGMNGLATKVQMTLLDFTGGLHARLLPICSSQAIRIFNSRKLHSNSKRLH